MSWPRRWVNLPAVDWECVVFRRKNPYEALAAALYRRTAEQARAPALFEACGIPDTLDGRFDALALHASLVIDRLRREPDGEALAQAYFDAMFRHLDLTLRELGVQDLGVGRRIKIMAEGLHGRALAYRAALAAGPMPLADALRRNAYGGRSPTDDQVARLEAHVRRYAAELASAAPSELANR
ncbi:MAG: ubiquinol-cytochrome C chaperone [Alphaproteobacteria bacterium]|nr:ubiquinol-cytochrome C chaperone [Alphaproteobacteria bacterium]